ncbi:MAG: acetate--CoA ligase family protein [Spirochaetia bacterium]|nr:acetate--CoA ligase family protein [Spirochaetia bacterium]
MKLFEYQAKEVFKNSGIPVPDSRLVHNRNEAAAAVDAVGTPCAVKSQLLMGGRGKAGLIKLAKNKDEALQIADELFSHPEGVRTLLIEEAVDIEKELYLSITLDPVKAEGLVIACAEGGVEIETLAKERPEAIVRKNFNLTRGLQAYQARAVVYDMGLSGDAAKQAVKILMGLYKAFTTYDAELIEINPLFLTKTGPAKEGQLIAGDGKLSIDDNAAHRQQEYTISREHFSSDMEYEAAKDGIPYLQFDGDISLMCAGAGLTTTVYDLINYEGGSVANYLEFGGPNYRRAMRAMELCLQNPSKVILIVTFGTIARADVMAQGVVEAIKKLKPNRPIVTCIRGTNEEDAVKILQEAGLTPIFDTEEAVRTAVKIAQGGAA